MSEVPENRKRGRGRPPRAPEKRTNIEFHLVLLKEEMDLFVAAADLAGASSTGAFLRGALRQFAADHNTLIQTIPKNLLPLPTDNTSKHAPLLLTVADLEKVHSVGMRNYSLFIRTAALAIAFSSPGRSEAFELALKSLESKKGGA